MEWFIGLAHYLLLVASLLAAIIGSAELVDKLTRKLAGK